MEKHSSRSRNIHSSLKIGLLGYGKMGKTVERLALEKKHLITSFDEADVLIDFSHPSVVIDNIQKAIQLNKNIVVGTTGWDSHLDQVKIDVECSEIGLIYSPNFSVGIHLFLNIISQAAELIDAFDCYDISALEAHHNQKEDLPSGTALKIGEILLKKISRKSKIAYGDHPFLKDQNQIHFPSIRSGNIPGMHCVTFDSAEDTITIKHEARNRDSFAKGAIAAAEWIINKKGFFNFNEMMNHYG